MSSIRTVVPSLDGYSTSWLMTGGTSTWPGAVAQTSTFALTNATLPYLVELATATSWADAARNPALALGFNTVGGDVTHPTVAESLGRPYRPLADALA